MVVEASRNISDRKWDKVQDFLRQFLLKLSSSAYKVSLSTFDRKLHMKYPFQAIPSESAVNDLMSKVARNKAENSAGYSGIVEHLYNHIFTEKEGSLSPHKILVLITQKKFDLQILDSIQRRYPEEQVTLLTVIMNLKTDDDDISFGFEDESSFTMAKLSRLIRRIGVENLSNAKC